MAYTNSPLVAHTRLSTNCTKPRNHTIDTITPHCVVGQVTAESLGNVFASSERKASSNYGIDKDGRVGMYVEEKDRSWCTSNAGNDNRAVTIECASDTKAPYTMNDAVYASLVNLCVDICKRNGKKKLLWFADKAQTLNYTPKSDEMLITVHRWFANKSCPGDWLYSRLGNLANEVTAKLGGASTVSTTKPTTVANTDKVIWDTLKSKGLNDFAVAGIMGNLHAESALNPMNLQNSYEKSLGHTDATYTEAVDNGSYTNFVKDSAGYGLAQWTYWSRKQNLLNYAKSVGKSIGDLGMQIEFLWTELQNYKTTIAVLKSAKSIKEASDVVLTEFERPANMSDSVKAKRASYGQQYYDKYASTEAKTETPTESTKTETITAVKEKKATEPAQNFRAAVGGQYKVEAKGGLYLRNGAGSNKLALCVMPYGTIVQNYGYYTSINGATWMYVVATVKGVKYTGFCSRAYLSKK